MQLVLFKVPPESLIEEIRHLLRSKVADEWNAGLDFFEALKWMRTKRQLRASPLPRASYASLLAPNESMWERSLFHHTLYLTRVPHALPPGAVEVRAVLVCNGGEPEPARISKAAQRHHKM